MELGLANHVVADPLAEAIACAKKIMELPQQARRGDQAADEHPAGEVGDGVAGLRQLAEYVSFGTADFNKIVDGLIAKK